jgi:hypothetical protein
VRRVDGYRVSASVLFPPFIEVPSFVDELFVVVVTIADVCSIKVVVCVVKICKRQEKTSSRVDDASIVNIYYIEGVISVLDKFKHQEKIFRRRY